MGHFRTVAVGLLVGGLALTTACSRDDETTSNDDDNTSESTAAPTSIAPAKDFTLAEPVKVVALIADPTNSSDPNATPEFNDGARMAVDEINAAGGIGGHDVEFVALDTAPVGDGALDAFNQAIDEQPTVIVGPISSSAALAISPRVNEAQVPVIQNTTDPQLAAGQPAASEWMFGSRPLNDASAAVAGQFAVEELDGAKVGLLSVSSSFGKQGVEGVKTGVTEAGGEITAERTFEFNATDLTEPALAMGDTDVIIDWGTPNTVTLAVTTLNQQGLGDKPHIGPGSVGFPSFAESVGDPELLENVYGAVDCNPVDDSRESTKAWVSRFEELYDYEANYASAELYDSIFMIRQVIEEAESSEATVIRDGLKALDWSGGVCAKRYVNKDNILMHQTVMTKFSDGALTTIKEYEGI